MVTLKHTYRLLTNVSTTSPRLPSAVGSAAVGLVIIAGMLVMPRPGAAQELPSASELLSRHIEAIGGRSAIESHTSRHLVGSFRAPSQGVSGDVQIFGAAPAKSRLEIEIPGFGAVLTGYDGHIGWLVHPLLGPQLLDGRSLDQVRQNANFYNPVGSERFIASRETIELTDFEGRMAYRVRVTTRWDEEYFKFYDAETGRLAGTIRTSSTPLGEFETTSIFGDYQKVDGVWMPMQWVQRSGLGEQIFEFETAEFDTVDEAVFALPAEIQALIETASSSRTER